MPTFISSLMRRDGSRFSSAVSIMSRPYAIAAEPTKARDSGSRSGRAPAWNATSSSPVTVITANKT